VPTKQTLRELPLKSEAAYVLTNNQLYYVNKRDNKIKLLERLSKQQLIEFKQQLKTDSLVVNEPRKLSMKEIDTVASITKHIHPQGEDKEHIELIVKQVLERWLSAKKPNNAGPILIHVEDKIKGQAIKEALIEAINKNRKRLGDKNQLENVQEFYSSEKSTPTERNEEERNYKELAGHDNIVMISSVFDRGTDIKPTHPKGLLVLQTYIDTHPYSSEDLERSNLQKFGRAGRKGQHGEVRLILKRSQFAEIMTDKQMTLLDKTKKAVHHAIQLLNAFRNKFRQHERHRRQVFEEIKFSIYSQFRCYVDSLNSSGLKTAETEKTRQLLFKHWNYYLQRIDEKWSNLQDSNKGQNLQTDTINIAKLACEKWHKTSKKLDTLLNGYKNRVGDNATILPALSPLNPNLLIKTVLAKYPDIKKYYVRESERMTPLDPMLSDEEVYCDFFALNAQTIKLATGGPDINKIKNAVTMQKIASFYADFASQAYRAKLKHLKLCLESFDKDKCYEQVKQMTAAYLYLQYKAYSAGNALGYAKFNSRYSQFIKQIQWSGDGQLINAMSEAQAEHYTQLAFHHGKHEDRKALYLGTLMAKANHLLPSHTAQWKMTHQENIWNPPATATSKPGLLSFINRQLMAYKSQSMLDGYVSKDRKACVNSLLGRLNQIKSWEPDAILAALNHARAQLLAEDIRQGRSLSAGLEGRFNSLLNAARARVLAMCDARRLDELSKFEFEDIKNILAIFERRLAKLKCMEPLALKLKVTLAEFDTENYHPVNDPSRYYHCLLKLFNQVEGLAALQADINDPDVNAFYRYCRYKNIEVVNYFGQCDHLKSINQMGSVGVVRAAQEAGTRFIARTQPIYSHAAIDKTFTYHDHTIRVATEGVLDKNIVSHPLYYTINNANAYRVLLNELEKAIVEKRETKTEVEFKQILLSSTELFGKEKGFKLRVRFAVNGVDTEVALHFNLKKRTVSCDYDLTNMRQFDLKTQTLPARIEETKMIDDFTLATVGQMDLDEIKNSITKLAKESSTLLQKIKPEDRVALYQGYTSDCKARRALGMHSLDFETYLGNLSSQPSEGIMPVTTGISIKA